jgi:hypothetical protein
MFFFQILWSRDWSYCKTERVFLIADQFTDEATKREASPSHAVDDSLESQQHLRDQWLAIITNFLVMKYPSSAVTNSSSGDEDHIVLFYLELSFLQQSTSI